MGFFERIFIIASFLLIPTFIQSQTIDDILRRKADSLGIQPIKNYAFKSGEELNFKIKWQASFISITAGYAKMKVLDTIFIKGRPCFPILVTAESTGFIETFYEVQDTIRTYIDVEYGMSWRFEKKTREASYFKDIFIDYNHVQDSASVVEIRYHDREGKNIRSKSEYRTKIYPFTQDILSSFYFMRSNHIEAGLPIKIPNNSKKKNYMLRVIINPLEEQDVNAGEFMTYRLLPIIEGESIFNQEGAMIVWLTKDKSHMPVRMKSAVKIGSVNVELESFTGIN